MKILFQVAGSGSFEGRTKDGRSFQRMRMMGFAIDCDNSRIPATADMSYGGSIPFSPKEGETLLVDIDSFDTRNAMASFTFRSFSRHSK